MSSRCQGTTLKGRVCLRFADANRDYCWQHINSTNLVAANPSGRTEYGMTIALDPTVVMQQAPKSIKLIIKPIDRKAAQSRSTGAVQTVKAHNVPDPRGFIGFNYIRNGYVTKQEYLTMSVVDRVKIPVEIVINTLMRHRLSYEDVIKSQGPTDRIIAHRKLRSRLDAFFHRITGVYIDLCGNKYYTVLFGRKSERLGPALYYGQPYQHPFNLKIRYLGEGELDLERKTYDPYFSQWQSYKCQGQSAQIDAYLRHKELIHPSYKTDVVTLSDLSEISDHQLIYTDLSGRAYYLPSIIGRWEAGFSLYDKDSARIVPQYPLNFNNEPMHPQLVLSIFMTYTDRQLNWEKSGKLSETPGEMSLIHYPLVGILCQHQNLLEDLYEFIIGYKQLTVQYDRLVPLYPEDEGMANRRDIMAIERLQEIYKRHNLEDYGYRKFATMPSKNGSNGTQIFYQHVLCSLFWKYGYRPAIDTQDDDSLPVNLRWEYLPGQSSAMLFGTTDIHICRSGYKYLVAFK
jgi:hypothetical protein